MNAAGKIPLQVLVTGSGLLSSISLMLESIRDPKSIYSKPFRVYCISVCSDMVRTAYHSHVSCFAVANDILICLLDHE